MLCQAVFYPNAIAKASPSPSPAGVAHDNVPEPFVTSAWPDVPSPSGNVKVVVVVKPLGALNAI